MQLRERRRSYGGRELQFKVRKAQQSAFSEFGEEEREG